MNGRYDCLIFVACHGDPLVGVVVVVVWVHSASCSFFLSQNHTCPHLAPSLSLSLQPSFNCALTHPLTPSFSYLRRLEI